MNNYLTSKRRQPLIAWSTFVIKACTEANHGDPMTFDTVSSPVPANASGVQFTERESTILRLIAAGRTNVETAAELHISHHTVAQHIAQMLHTIGARSRAELVARAYCIGLLSADSWPPELRSC
jgi:DNA-binding CsgD family transcriptional regulator